MTALEEFNGNDDDDFKVLQAITVEIQSKRHFEHCPKKRPCMKSDKVGSLNLQRKCYNE